MDLLSIVTGIGLTAFLLLYLAFSLEKEHWVLKIMTVGMAIILMMLIPQATIEADKDCAILNNGTYACYYSNGTQVSDFEGGSSVGTTFLGGYLNYLIFFGTYLFLYLFYRVFTHFRRLGAEKRHG